VSKFLNSDGQIEPDTLTWTEGWAYASQQQIVGGSGHYYGGLVGSIVVQGGDSSLLGGPTTINNLNLEITNADITFDIDLTEIPPGTEPPLIRLPPSTIRTPSVRMPPGDTPDPTLTTIEQGWLWTTTSGLFVALDTNLATSVVQQVLTTASSQVTINWSNVTLNVTSNSLVTFDLTTIVDVFGIQYVQSGGSITVLAGGNLTLMSFATLTINQNCTVITAGNWTITGGNWTFTALTTVTFALTTVSFTSSTVTITGGSWTWSNATITFNSTCTLTIGAPVTYQTSTFTFVSTATLLINCPTTFSTSTITFTSTSTVVFNVAPTFTAGIVLKDTATGRAFTIQLGTAPATQTLTLPTSLPPGGSGDLVQITGSSGSQTTLGFTTMSGDATIGSTGAIALKATGPGATGPVGDSTHVAAVTIDAQGRVTALSSVAISGGGGAVIRSYSGTTTNAYVTVFDITNSGNPLIGCVSIRNTDGANALLVRLTVTDYYGGTASSVSTITPNSFGLWDLEGFSGSNYCPPYQEVMLEVQDQFAGSHATYTAKVGTAG
jgi:hypothetical protein